jgi:hypothetical protein
MLGVSILTLSTILIFDFGIILTLWYFFSFDVHLHPYPFILNGYECLFHLYRDCHLRWWGLRVQEEVSDCCLAPTQQFSAISWREQVNLQ